MIKISQISWNRFSLTCLVWMNEFYFRQILLTHFSGGQKKIQYYIIFYQLRYFCMEDNDLFGFIQQVQRYFPPFVSDLLKLETQKIKHSLSCCTVQITLYNEFHFPQKITKPLDSHFFHVFRFLQIKMIKKNQLKYINTFQFPKKKCC